MKLASGCRYWKPNEIVNVVFDKSEEYRYLLEVEWENSSKAVTFVMLNPSYADSNICDLTLNRCINFSKLWGYGKMNIVNLFGLRSSNPQRLYNHNSPIGPENDKYILKAAKESNLVILHGVKNTVRLKIVIKKFFFCYQIIILTILRKLLKETIQDTHPA